MRVVMRKRYYCDHCAKTGGSSYHMKRHEAGCTNNPERVCGVCRLGEFSPVPLAELIVLVRSKAIAWHPGFKDPDDVSGELDEAGFAALSAAADGCPACILAALRQSSIFHSDFKFKEAMMQVWANVNDARNENVGY